MKLAATTTPLVPARTRFGIIIPARYGSTRLPGKPLRDLAGKPLVVRVLENARAAGADFLWVATDDERIARAVQGAGGTVVMTRADHVSGTDRLAEAAMARALPAETIVVNVQGDEPLLEPEHVRSVAAALAAHPEAGIATLATAVRGVAELFDPSAVKVVTDARGMALYFSRAPLPWARDHFEAGRIATELPDAPAYLRHVGLYAYTVGTLRRLASSPPAPMERLESLEQLRALWLGIGIHVTVTADPPPPGVDTELDLQRAAQVFRARADHEVS